jgi:hypothetical protein
MLLNINIVIKAISLNSFKNSCGINVMKHTREWQLQFEIKHLIIIFR